VTTEVTITELKKRWGELTRAVREQDETVVVRRRGQSLVALISIDRFNAYLELMRAERSAVPDWASDNDIPGVQRWPEQ
jgi:prevent-host-death family protein